MKQSANSSIFFRSILSVLGIVLVTLLILNLVRFFRSAPNVSFAAFLDYLSTVQSFDFSGFIQKFTIGGSWGVVDGLRQFLNVFASLLGFLVYIAGSLFNLLTFVLGFVRFVFV